ncbi:MAG: hypothetical protein P4L51_19390 [Puia sp.]|nr:hypothetical protein [Puia sp.]
MLNSNILPRFMQLPQDIKIEWIDESGNSIDANQLNEVEYLSRFLNKWVVRKICTNMIADRRSGTIRVYHDRVQIQEN